MPFPRPVPGLVIRYSYLWMEEAGRGQEEGTKDRPCAVVLVTVDADDDQVVTVLPVTHASPSDPEIPPLTKQRLGLDDERSWVILTEANRFVWPGPDLRRSNRGEFAFGVLPYRIFEDIRQKFIMALKSRRARIVPRTD